MRPHATKNLGLFLTYICITVVINYNKRNGSGTFVVEMLNPKVTRKGWGWGQFDPSSGFSETVISREWVRPYFFVTFNIIIRHIFPENFIQILPGVQMI